jgi:tRNA(fMet)-specific endonuclease VapC
MPLSQFSPKIPSALQLVQRSPECFLPVIVLGELYYGVQQSARADENRLRIDAFRSSIVILPCDETTAEQYGRIKKQLRIAGTPIPENDIWIASIAHQYQLTLMSNDAHFDKVNGIGRIGW